MDAKAKVKLLRSIPSGLYIIGVRSGDQLDAFTGSWLCQVSMNPPMVMLGVRHQTSPLNMIKSEQVFSVNYLKKEDQKTAEHFFKRNTHPGARLKPFSHFTQKTGTPLLEDAIGYLECQVKKIIEDVGDHAIVVGEVINAALVEDVPPLLLTDTPWNYGG